MDLKQNPFSLYDFLGYLVPGAVLVYSIGFLHKFFELNNKFVFSFISNVDYSSSQVYIKSLIFSYIAGHFVSFVSAVTVERFSVWRYGYPSKYLLCTSNKKYLSCKNKIDKSHRIIVFLFLLPIAVIDYFVDLRKFNIGKMDDYLVTITRVKMSYIINKIYSSGDKPVVVHAAREDFFRPVYHYCLENSEYHQAKFLNYVSLYGFTRSICLVFNILSLLSSIIIILMIFGYISNITISYVSLSLFTIMCMSLSYVFYLSFIKFYKRFSLEVLMCALVIE